MRRFLIAGGRTALTIVAIFTLWSMGGCRQDGAQHTGSMDAHAEHEHETENDAFISMSLDEIAAARCEHDIPAYQCDDCRYEVGVVKVSPHLLENSSSGEGGLLTTEIVARRRVTTGLDVTGEIQLNENAAVHISPRIPGIIETVHVDIGTRVKKGDLLFKINSVELGKTLAAFELNRALTELSRKNLEREKLLLERKIASEQDMIEAQMAYERHKTELVAAEQALHIFGLTEDDLSAFGAESHGSNLGCLPVRAAIDGTIIQKHAVVGELVEPGKDVLLLADLRSLWVWADVYEEDLPQLLAAEGKGSIPVRIFVSAYPDQAFIGSIDYIGATMDEKTRTVKVRASVLNPDGQLRPGMFCEINIGLHSDETVVAIPNVALLTDEQESFVFSYWKEDYYVRRAVRTGREFFDMVEVIAGLGLGERIVTEGAFLLKSDVLREKMGAGCAD